MSNQVANYRTAILVEYQLASMMCFLKWLCNNLITTEPNNTDQETRQKFLFVSVCALEISRFKP